MPLPADCTTKAEIRSEIDSLDRQLVALLATRFAYVRRMAQLKSTPADAHDQGRVDDVLAKVAAEANRHQLDHDLIQTLWRILIDWNIAYEASAIGKRTGSSASGGSAWSGSDRRGTAAAPSES